MGEKVMDRENDTLNNFNHAVTINERKNVLITGVKKLENFDSREFFLESIMGFILIKGEGLELIKLDTFQGTLSIKGKVNSLNYLESANGGKAKGESMLSKLFK